MTVFCLSYSTQVKREGAIRQEAAQSVATAQAALVVAREEAELLAAEERQLNTRLQLQLRAADEALKRETQEREASKGAAIARVSLHSSICRL